MPTGPERIQQALDQAGIEAQVLRLPDSTRTAPDAARAVGCDVGAIVKSLLFLADGKPVLVMCAGDRKVDTEQIASYLGVSRVTMAPVEDVRRITGYAIGGVPPLGHTTPIRTFMDHSLLRWPIVYAAAGAHDALFGADPQRLLQVTGAELVEVGSG